MSDKIEAFNIVADNYDDWYTHPQGKQVFEAELKAVEEMIPKRGLGVEIGAGTGFFTYHLSSPERKILCLDPSVEMLSRAKNRGLHCIIGLGDSIPLRQGVIDFGYLVTVLEFLDKSEELLIEFRENAKAYAPISILFINAESKWGGFYRKIGKQGDTVFQHAKLYSPRQVIKLLNKAGYKVKKTIGTLNSDPFDEKVDQRLVKASETSGIIIIKAIPKKYS
ncbi:methyltransferase domain-containing protein [Candidatus Bathyarchaeota archaeon]|nr:methyltransferase domain-containing protein [Candidatus Bathyarchaeota archaeon]